MDPIIQILLSAGGATILAAIINAVMNRRKLSAEATEIITRAAAGTVENVTKDNELLREKVLKLEEKIEQMRAAQALHDARERAHLEAEERCRRHTQQGDAYTAVLISRLRALDQEIPVPPPRWSHY